MWRDADAQIRGLLAANVRERVEDGAHAAREAPLPRLERLLSESRPAIKRRQDGDGNTGIVRGVHVPVEHLGWIVYVMELGHRGVAVLQHLDVELRRDRLRLLRRQPLHEL